MVVLVTRVVMAECSWWKGWVVTHTAVSICVGLVCFIQLVRTVQAERETVQLRAGRSDVDLPSANPLLYEEGR